MLAQHWDRHCQRRWRPAGLMQRRPAMQRACCQSSTKEAGASRSSVSVHCALAAVPGPQQDESLSLWGLLVLCTCYYCSSCRFLVACLLLSRFCRLGVCFEIRGLRSWTLASEPTPLHVTSATTMTPAGMHATGTLRLGPQNNFSSMLYWGLH